MSLVISGPAAQGRASLVAQLVKNPPVLQKAPVQDLDQEDSPGEGIVYPLQYSWASLVTQLDKNLPGIPGLGRFPWRRPWQPTPVFLPGESHGQRSLAGYSPWGYKELDTLKHPRLAHIYIKDS